MPLSPEIQICVDAGVIRIEQVALLDYRKLMALKSQPIRELFLDGKITFEQLNLGFDQHEALKSETIRNLFLDGKITFEQLNLGYNQREALKSESIRNLFLDGKITFEQLNLGYNQRDALKDKFVSKLIAGNIISINQIPERCGILYDLQLTIKKLNAAADDYVTNHQSLLNTMRYDISLLYAYFYAMIEFRSFLNGNSRALGISNGFFSLSRHKIKEADLFDKLSGKVDLDATQYCANVIKVNGSLYDPRLGENHSFSNFFLASLYQHNVTAYRKVVGTAYGIVFLDGSAVTLYRRDTRHYRQIFDHGFDLQSCNTAVARKHFYSEPWTYAYGVSTAKVIPSTHYGMGGYFTILFPHDHQFLLIDIVETCRLRGRLHERNNVANVHEVNCMQAIPVSNIRFFTLEKVNPHRIIKNNHAVTLSGEPDKKIQYGVY